MPDSIGQADIMEDRESPKWPCNHYKESSIHIQYKILIKTIVLVVCLVIVLVNYPIISGRRGMFWVR